MLDLKLLRVPTFNGGLIAAFAISASIFALLTYLVLYLQNVLGSSAIDTGIRLLPFTGAIFLTAGLAGRLTGRVPIRLLIGPGFVLIGAGLLLMSGIAPSDDWTHLLPGMIVGGVGCGLVNVPLASTAVGVVEPARAGMASGINSTFRQIGIATGVAALGSILASEVSSSMISKLSGGPLAHGSHTLASAVSNGSILQAMQLGAGQPAGARVRRRPRQLRRRAEHDPADLRGRRVRRGRSDVRADPTARLRRPPPRRAVRRRPAG